MRWAIISMSLMCCSFSWAPRCVSTCGAVLWGSPTDGSLPESWTCEEFQRAETKAVKVLGATLDSRSQRACGGLYGVAVYVAPEPTWVDPDGRSIAGKAICDLQQLEVGSSPPLQGAFAHEIAHLAQDCNAPLPIDPGLTREHANWNRARIFDAVNIWYPEP